MVDGIVELDIEVEDVYINRRARLVAIISIDDNRHEMSHPLSKVINDEAITFRSLDPNSWIITLDVQGETKEIDIPERLKPPGRRE